jgi:predicted nicotinamide N-methyase
MLQLLRRNVSHNAHRFPEYTTVEVAELDWSKPLPFVITERNRKFDIILASEVLYDETSIPLFVSTLQHLSHKGTVVYLVVTYYSSEFRSLVEKAMIGLRGVFTCDDISDECSNTQFLKIEQIVLYRLICAAALF